MFNLHGSGRRRESIPETERDENVFDILQGVTILLCVKERDNLDSAKIYYADMWGNREEKYKYYRRLMSSPRSGVCYNRHPVLPFRAATNGL